MIDAVHKERVRLAELDLVRRYFSVGDRVLEIGAGAGWQARELGKMGLIVEAIDVDPDTSPYLAHRIWPVLKYDGRTIPFPDHQFQVVFSSNVLEHIPHIEAFQAEIHRVLTDRGLAIHLMPTASWRFWTNVARFFVPMKWLVATIGRRSGPRPDAKAKGRAKPSGSDLGQSFRRNTFWGVLRKAVIPVPHGAVGNGITEMYHFSRHRWLALFERTGWEVVSHRSNRLFYSGYAILGPLLSVRTRRLLSYLLGGSCRVYLLKSALR